jgi:sec-independent protein translocase protein TatA
MFGLGFGEILIVLLIALIFIGPKKLPELAKGLGKGIRDFQNAAKGFSDQMQETITEAPKNENKNTTHS